MVYSRIQVMAMVTGVLGFFVMLAFAKLFHDMDAGYLPYVSLLGSFVCISGAKAVFFDGQ